MRAETLRSLAMHALFLSVVLGLWEWAARVGWIDPRSGSYSVIVS